jgi:hypothetical protein
MDLMAAGYVEGEEGVDRRYRLTAKGQGVLSERVVGANES